MRLGEQERHFLSTPHFESDKDLQDHRLIPVRRGRVLLPLASYRIMFPFISLPVTHVSLDLAM